MKKLIYFLFPTVCLLSAASVNAQIEIDSSFRTAINNVFVNLDKSRIPYGILRDYAMEFTNLENFNGTTPLVDSNYVTGTVFWEVYNTLLTGRVNTSVIGLLRQDTLDNRWYNSRQAGRITLGGLYFNYSRFRDDAANNYITISNNQLFDKFIGGVWQNPYQSEQVFVISPSVSLYSGIGFTVLLPSSTWLTNNASVVSSLSIDLGDGAGYRTLTPDVPLTVSYSSAGNKEWTYRLNLVSGSFLYAHTRFTITGSGAQ